jgi:hypothetical protein
MPAPKRRSAFLAMPPADRSAAFAALSERAIVCPLAEVGSIGVDGPDAAGFLHGQLSSDVNALAAGAWQWSSYNSPKGRMLASVLLARADAPDRYRALLAGDLAAAIAKRLSMFVLRAKVKVNDASPGRMTIGVAGPRAADAVRSALGVVATSGQVTAFDHGFLVGLADGRIVVDVDRTRGESAIDALGAHATRVDSGIWRWTRVRAGVPLLTAATSDQFVPQALNWELLGGVSFQKGCYPGQEIVARTQYLGRLKERLFAFRLAADEPSAGARLYAPSFGDQACGTVIDASPHPEGGAALLAVAQRSAAEAETLHAGSLDGPPLERLPLPYAVPEPVAPRNRIA